MRVLLDHDPFADSASYSFEGSRWRGQWIGHPDHRGQEAVVLAFRRRWDCPSARRLRLHVSADERYELYLDGQRIGRGSERGDPWNWFFESYDLELPVGPHTLVARVWWLGGGAPYAQYSFHPALLLVAQGEGGDVLNTGAAGWEVKAVGGYTFLSPQAMGGFFAVGAKQDLDGRGYPWGVEKGEGDGWVAAQAIARAHSRSQMGESVDRWLLRPAVLPPMLEESVHVGLVRHVSAPQSPEALPTVQAGDHRPNEAGAWQRLLSGQGSVTVAPHSCRRVILDLENYYCAYPDLVLSGGCGAAVRIFWAEALFEQPKGWDKGQRDELEGKYFRGMGDTFRADGGRNRAFTTLWWSAGRYIEILVTTGDEALTLDRFTIRETHYPWRFEGDFQASRPALASVTPIALRTLEMCSHETYMDCPYYEQLMYVGDTRLEVLTSYLRSRDDRLPRKALLLFDQSRGPDGLTHSRYPTRVRQIIPPFSLWWIAMVHDYARWRDDGDLVQQLMPGVRAVVEAYLPQVAADGLLHAPGGWNFMDWAPGWKGGIPPLGPQRTSAILSWQLVLVLTQAAELEDRAGETELAQRLRRRASVLAAATDAAFWVEERGLYADDSSRATFSEHAQCLAMLSGLVPPGRKERMAQSLFAAADLTRATIYFLHYLFEVCRLTGRVDVLLQRLDLWTGLPGRGLKTTIESPEPTRSDCHAWGAHPVFHFGATILGVRPDGWGFGKVRIQPQLGSLAWAHGAVPHPKGMITVSARREPQGCQINVELPPDLHGELVWAGQNHPIGPGPREFHLGPA